MEAYKDSSRLHKKDVSEISTNDGFNEDQKQAEKKKRIKRSQKSLTILEGGILLIPQLQQSWSWSMKCQLSMSMTN